MPVDDYSDYRTPGQLLADLLAEKGWSQKVFAAVSAMREPLISQIICGERAIDAEMALDFEMILGIKAEVFLELQKSYDLAKARITARPDPGRANRATLFASLPVKEMIKRRWLETTDLGNAAAVESSLLKFFGVTTLDEIEVLPHAAKKTHVAQEVTPPQLAWIYRVRQIAEDMLAGQYSEIKVRAALKELEPLMMSAESTRKVPRLLGECGIRFIVCESIGSANIDGVCFWLDERSPVIGMTLRYDRIDNFWFVLRHELEHVIRLHGRDAIVLDAELEGARAGIGPNVADEERIANQAAADFGVSQLALRQFINRKAPFFREVDVLGFAKTEQVHPGIVAGRVRYATDRYDILSNYLVKVRSRLLTTAMVDGWGQVAPVAFKLT